MKHREELPEQARELTDPKILGAIQDTMNVTRGVRMEPLKSGIVLVTEDESPAAETVTTRLREAVHALRGRLEVSTVGGCLKRITPESPRTIRAKSDLFLSDWSRGGGYAHGSDTLIPLGNLARLLLETGETLTTLDTVKWRQLLFCNVDLTASLDPIANRQDAAILARFTSSKGKKIHIVGRMNREQIRKDAPANPVAQDMTARYGEARPEGDGFVVPLVPPSHDAPLLLDEQEAGKRFATVSDILNHSLRPVFYQVRPVPGAKALVTGLKDLTLPPLDDLLKNGGSVFVRLGSKSERPGRAGFRFFTVEAEFRDNRNHPLSKGTILLAFHEKQNGGERYVTECHRQSEVR
jgi:hypothetical protein